MGRLVLTGARSPTDAVDDGVARANERRSAAVISNLHPSGFDTIMPKTLATATVDRLLHHAHVVLTEGASYRLAEATAGKGWCRSADRGRRSAVRRRGDHVSAEMEISCPPKRKSRCPLTAPKATPSLAVPPHTI
jgi:hypothetical protein